jgi:hypothetical protein
MREQVTLFPVAIGDEPTLTTIMANPNNAGRSDGEVRLRRATVETDDIPVERLDNLLSPDLRVDLMKYVCAERKGHRAFSRSPCYSGLLPALPRVLPSHKPFGSSR